MAFAENRIECGHVTFPPLTFTEPGIYRFTLRELTPSGEGWITDGAVFPVVVTVVEEGAALVPAVEYPGGEPCFVNTYRRRPAVATIVACKATTGCFSPRVGIFTFSLFDAAGTLAATAANRTDGSVVFPILTYHKPGLYTYTIAETASSDPCWATDDTVHRVAVIVETDGRGVLRARVVYEWNRIPVFCNRYICRNACCRPCCRCYKYRVCRRCCKNTESIRRVRCESGGFHIGGG